MSKVHIVERAFQLARSGTCRGIVEIKNHLRAERYDGIESQLAGASIKKQLSALCVAAEKHQD